MLDTWYCRHDLLDSYHRLRARKDAVSNSSKFPTSYTSITMWGRTRDSNLLQETHLNQLISINVEVRQLGT